MRLSILLDTNGQENSAAAERRRSIARSALRAATIAVTIATAWALVGSVIYPLYWYEFLWKGGILNFELFKYGGSYLLDHEVWIVIALPASVIAGVFIAWRFWDRLRRFLDRFSAPVVLCCALALSVDAVWLKKTQAWQYETAWALVKLSDGLVQAVNGLADLVLPPSRILPPADFLYADERRIAILFNEIEPALREREDTISSQNRVDGSMGFERKPVSVKVDGSRGTTETHTFASVDPSTQRQCLDVMNNLLAREAPPYYTTFRQLSEFAILRQTKEVLDSAHKGLSSRSLFTMQRVDATKLSVLRQLTEARKGAPPRAIDSAVRAQLRQLSGLMIVGGDFRRVSRTPEGDTFEEQFRREPRAIFFRFVLRDKTALSMIPNRANLWVLGDMIAKWSGGPFGFLPDSNFLTSICSEIARSDEYTCPASWSLQRVRKLFCSSSGVSRIRYCRKRMSNSGAASAWEKESTG